MILRLTALWALSESALGGIMHAVKMPFTGLFLGGFAVLIMGLLAQHSTHTARTILSATLMVIAIKFVAAPHTPFTAYIAVAFQGLMGAMVFSFLPVNKIAMALVGLLALAESALQRILMMTLVFGKNIWEAIDAFFVGITKELHLGHGFSLSYGLMVAYVGIYIVVGFAIGWWGASWIKNMDKEAPALWQRAQQLQQQTTLPTAKKKKWRWLIGASILLFIVTVFMAEGWNQKAGYAILRTFAALLLFWFVINPIVRWVMGIWMKNRKDSVTPVMELLPQMRSYIAPALQLARQAHKGLRVYPAFVKNLLLLSLYDVKDEGEQA